jgi:hypothetical protein
MEKSLIQFFPAYFVIVNQPTQGLDSLAASKGIGAATPLAAPFTHQAV